MSASELAQSWRAVDYPRVQELQRRFSESSAVQEAIDTFAREVFPEQAICIGRPRMRVVFPDGHEVAAAAPAYLPHRDTWFANPSAQINWWSPLVPIDASNSFGFYPQFFAEPIDNNSAEFDYVAWQRKGGFQSRGQGVYPSARPTQAANVFSCSPGEVLCFSAAHLHQTLPLRSEHARISFDFRTVLPVDRIEERGAPEVDNAAMGDACVDYRELSPLGC